MLEIARPPFSPFESIHDDKDAFQRAPKILHLHLAGFGDFAYILITLRSMQTQVFYSNGGVIKNMPFSFGLLL